MGTAGYASPASEGCGSSHTLIFDELERGTRPFYLASVYGSEKARTGTQSIAQVESGKVNAERQICKPF